MAKSRFRERRVILRHQTLIIALNYPHWLVGLLTRERLTFWTNYLCIFRANGAQLTKRITSIPYQTGIARSSHNL